MNTNQWTLLGAAGVLAIATAFGAVAGERAKGVVSVQVITVTVGDENRDVLAASDLIGATVENAKGEPIGEIEDLVINADDRVLYAIVSVGGFLDIGDKLVAVPYDELRVVEDSMVYDVTREDLESAPAFLWNEPNRAASVDRPRGPAASIWTKKVRI